MVPPTSLLDGVRKYLSSVELNLLGTASMMLDDANFPNTMLSR